MWLTPDAPDGSTVGRVLIIPAVYAKYIDGALEDLTDDFNWEQFGSQTPGQAASAIRDILDAYYTSTVVTDISGGLTTIPVWNPQSAPNGWAFAADATAFYGGRYSFSSTVQNNEVSWLVRLGAGTWTLSALIGLRTANGIITWSIDGATVGTMDGFGGASANNVREVAGIVIGTGGEKTLRAKMLTKNASATQFGILLQALSVRQTA